MREGDLGTQGVSALSLGCHLPSLASFSPQARNAPVWFPSHEEPLPSSNCAIRAGDKGEWLAKQAPCRLGTPVHSSRVGRPGSASSSLSSSSAVSYDVYRPDHSGLTLQLPVTASVREVLAALAQADGRTSGQVLVKVNSAGGELWGWILGRSHPGSASLLEGVQPAGHTPPAEAQQPFDCGDC